MFNPSFEDHSESTIECDTIILAIGQAPRLDFLTPEDGVEISARGRIVADRKTLMTTAPGVFAGGLQPLRGGLPRPVPAGLVTLPDVAGRGEDLAEVGSAVGGETGGAQRLKGERLVVEQKPHGC